MKVIGFKRNDFTTKEGATVTGLNLYLAHPVTGSDADGMVAERVYMSDAKPARCGYKPKVADEVSVLYNRYGKPESISKI